MNQTLNIQKEPICTCSTKSKGSLALYVITKADPTNTMPIVRAFDRQLRIRFAKIKKGIRDAINKQDCFGLKPVVYVTLPGNGAFAFGTSGDKVTNFMDWLRTQVDNDMLDLGFFQQSGQAINNAWTNVYITDTYERGRQRALIELKKAGYTIPEDAALGASLSTPFHADRLGLLYTRTFNELKGITDAMNNQISRVLSEGMMNGDSPYRMSRKLVAVIDGKGAATLGINDTLGRFIPAERRAKMLARTEVIRAHHTATIQEYKNWGAEGVTVQAEWSTAKDNRVCPLCAPLEGKFYTLEAIAPMIPRHPNCRCLALPARKKDIGSSKVETKPTPIPKKAPKLSGEAFVNNHVNSLSEEYNLPINNTTFGKVGGSDWVEGEMNSVKNIADLTINLKRVEKGFASPTKNLQTKALNNIKTWTVDLQDWVALEDAHGIAHTQKVLNRYISELPKTSKYWSSADYATTLNSRLATVVDHEFGHAIYYDRRMLPEMKSKVANHFHKMIKDPEKFSKVYTEYAKTDFEEFLSEAFALNRKGLLKDKEMIKILKEIDKLFIK